MHQTTLVPVTQEPPKEIPVTPRTKYLDDYRIGKLREKAEGWACGGCPAISVQCETLIALIDEVNDLRARVPRALGGRRPWWAFWRR